MLLEILMRRFLFATLVLAALVVPRAPLAAQATLTITGRVNSTAGEALPSSNVSLVGSTLGAISKDDGTYVLLVPADRVTGQPATLRVRRIGYRDATATITLTAGRQTRDFVLTAAPTQLEGVVVTALGIERDKRSLGVAQQSVAPEELTQAREPNIVNALSGKVAGVQVTNNGPPGGSARIVIRGANSVAGNNQPLFVIDGIPIDNSSTASTGSGRNSGFGGLDFGNAASDINPNDIESISVLKGANAAALYGARAANGAVVITTKSGRGSKGLGVNFTQNVTFETPLKLPEFQDVYGQGSGGLFAYKDGKGGGINDNVNRSWGPKMDGRLITQWWSNGVPAPWVPAPDNVRDFFDTGRTSTTNLAVTGASDRADVRLAATELDVKSMYPTNTLRRLNTSLAGGAKINDKLSARANLNYVRGVGHNRPGTGYDANSALFNIEIWGGRQRDLPHLINYINPDGTQFGPNHTTTNNPYWDVYADPNDDTRDRLIGSGSLTYKFNNWLSATGRSGTDWYRDWRKQEYADGNIAVDYSGGAFFEQNLYSRETNSDVMFTAEPKLNSKLAATFNLGGNLRDSHSSIASQGTNHLVIPGTFNIGNSAVTPQVSSFESVRRTNSAYGQAQLSWNNYLFTDITGRNDWSSTLPQGSNSYFYPSVSGSFVFTDAFPSTQLGPWLTYGKLRASWATVGNDADPYQLAVTYAAGTPFGSVPRFGVPNTIPNAHLKPERTSSWEAGGEFRLLDDRVSLDATYYNKLTSNQIIPAQITPAIGFTSAVVNAGSIRNKGVELQSTITPIRSAGGFNWDVVVNYAKNNSKVESLYPGLQTVVLGAYWGLSVEARLDQPYGTLYGNPYLRNADGKLILQNGLPRVDPNQVVLGHYTPDWIGGLQNRFHYGDFDFSFLIDTRQGGKIFSTTKMFGEESGVLKSSLRGRENGETLAEGGGLVVDGVNADGTPNTTKVTAQAYFNSLFQLHEANMVDASFVKLREARLGWAVPSRYLSRIRVTSMNVALVGRNLWLHAKAPDIDPEGAFDNGNVQGIEFVNFPSARSLGFVLNVTP
jgi:TonB-linked SusC/RagA family outer membrane protein